ncbi:putative hydro-lyase [Ralstonia pickettii]|uniref:Putative hydro-lyase C0Q88_14905 n=1 Tax=Ralstonia pickettii TaxID=329 RepID=A0A2N4TQB1_RALPI|nr:MULTISPECIES: putative hydro-lyase [Ralstonia]PLC41895.1 putative hydro-lyase [Ralstonia pickettii]
MPEQPAPAPARTGASVAYANPYSARLAARSGVLRGHTSGLCDGYVQANIVMLRDTWANEFLRFCQLNPKPCPLLDVTEPGVPVFRHLGQDVDVRRDVPRYRVYRNGELADEPADVEALWTDDMVAFAIGCSFSFEHALMEAGVPLRHIALSRNVAMYRTSIETVGTSRLAGKLVVSMRPMTVPDAIRAIEITSRMPRAHGAPVHFGDPAAIGIADISQPDWGDAVPVQPGEVPVFWACGVTPQAVVQQARPELCITHAPGHMLITDLRTAALA